MSTMASSAAPPGRHQAQVKEEAPSQEPSANQPDDPAQPPEACPAAHDWEDEKPDWGGDQDGDEGEEQAAAVNQLEVDETAHTGQPADSSSYSAQSGWQCEWKSGNGWNGKDWENDKWGD